MSRAPVNIVVALINATFEHFCVRWKPNQYCCNILHWHVELAIDQSVKVVDDANAKRWVLAVSRLGPHMLI